MPRPSPLDLETFITDGFVRIDRAFPRELADAARAILWRRHGLQPRRSRDLDPARSSASACSRRRPFVEAANTPALHAAFDRLVGPGRWLPRGSAGDVPRAVPVAGRSRRRRLAHRRQLRHDDPDFMSTGAPTSTRRAARLLMLFLFSDVGDDDAPTRIRVGSHADIARAAGAGGRAGADAARARRRRLRREGALPRSHRDRRRRHGLPVPSVPGARGAAASGARPRFLAQPPLLPASPSGLDLERGEAPVERAIRRALDSAA